MALANQPNSMLHPKGQVVRVVLSGRLPRSPGSVVRLTDSWRSAVLAAFEGLENGRGSFLLSGRCADGTPDKVHAHAFYLPEVDREDTIIGLRIVSPLAPFPEDEMCALRSVAAVTWAGPSTLVNLVLTDDQDPSLFEVASTWVSVTPFVPQRAFHQDRVNLMPARQLTRELEADLDGQGSVIETTCTPIGRVPVRCAPKAGDNRPTQLAMRMAYKARFRTAKPICGPVLLGHSAHFGLGQFRPAAAVEV